MKKNILFIAMAVSAISIFSQKSNSDLLKKIVDGQFLPKATKELRPLADGEHFSRLNSDSTAILQCAYKNGKVVDTLFSVSTARDCDFKKIEGYDLSNDETKLLIYTAKEQIFRRSFKADYYVYERKRNIVYPLSKGGKQQYATFSPNGRMVAFARDANLFLVKLDYGTESQMTKDGEADKVTYGVADWVYEEEFGLTRAFEWSPDDAFVAFLRFDQTKVKNYNFPVYRGVNSSSENLSDYPDYKRVKYPRAGQSNSQVSVQSFQIATKVIRTMTINDDDVEYIPRIRFTPEANRLAVFTLNRQQNKFTIYNTNPGSGLSRILMREENGKYIDNDLFDQIVFYPDQIVYVSDRDGYRHIYDYSPIGVLRRQVTKGSWEVTNFLGYNAATGVYYYESNEGSPLRNAVYSLDGKSRKICLTPGNGTSHAEFSANYRYFVNNFSNDKTPNVTDIRDAEGKTLTVLEANSDLKAKIASQNIQAKEFFTFKNKQSVELNGWMVKPSNFDPQKRYPVVMVQYGGPGTQEVKDEYRVDWEQFLAQKGYIVVCVDGRGTGGRGEQFGKQTYLHLGLMEAEDQTEAARYLSTLSYINKDKIAIWGWSYGGYNVLMSMSLGSGVFKAGIAVAPVTDWRFYDTVYTERYMRTPGENNDGYELSAAGHYASQLQGNLLLVHGTADDNVQIQQTYEYAEQLVQAGKLFDMQIYTNRDHFIKGGNTRLHLYETFVRFLDRNM